MRDLDDIEYAVIDNDAGDSEALCLVGDKETAEKVAAALSECPDGTPLEIVKVGDGFYIDVDMSYTSTFSIY